MREFPLDSKYLKGPVLHNFLAKTLPKRKFCFRVTPWVHWVKWLKLWKNKCAKDNWPSAQLSFTLSHTTIFSQGAQKAVLSFCVLWRNRWTQNGSPQFHSLTAMAGSVRRWKPNPASEAPDPLSLAGQLVVFARARIFTAHTFLKEVEMKTQKPHLQGAEQCCKFQR